MNPQTRIKEVAWAQAREQSGPEKDSQQANFKFDYAYLKGESNMNPMPKQPYTNACEMADNGDPPLSVWTIRRGSLRFHCRKGRV